MAKTRDRSWPPPPTPLPHPVIDNHTHLQSISHITTSEAPDHGIRGYIDAAVSVGVTRMIEVGCDLDALAPTVALTAAHPELLGALAIHPNETPSTRTPPTQARTVWTRTTATGTPQAWPTRSLP